MTKVKNKAGLKKKKKNKLVFFQLVHVELELYFSLMCIFQKYM